MEQRISVVCLMIACLARAVVPQTTGSVGGPSTESDSGECCRKSNDAITRLTSALTARLDALHELLESSISRGSCDQNGIVPEDCSAIDKTSNGSRSGVYQVYIPNSSIGPRFVYCDLTDPTQNYLVIQRRKDGSEIFERTWKEYADGFGNLRGEFWFGNEALYALTNTFNYKLRIELEDFDGQKRYAEYSSFKVASSADNYRLTVSGYSGDAGDSLSYHTGHQFSTKDADHDAWPNNCAQTFHGAWWYNSCHYSNLNGLYLRGNHSSYADGVEWYAFRGYYYSLKFAEMKIARV